MAVLLQLLANGLATGCLYALVALGLALIYNTTRVFHFAHGAMYVLGAYLCYVFFVQLSLPLFPAVIFAVTVTAFLGILPELLVYAPLAKRRGSALVALLSALGLYVALVNLIALLFGNETKVLQSGVEAPLRFGSVILTRVQVAQLISASLLLLLVLLLLRTTTWGTMIRAVRDNPTLTMVMGFNVWTVRLLVFALGSALAGVAAILSALDVGMDPQAGMSVLLAAAVALIVGGIGTFEGAVLGAFLLSLLQSVTIWQVSAQWMDTVTFGLLILTLLVRPEGLLGKRRRVEEATA